MEDLQALKEAGEPSAPVSAFTIFAEAHLDEIAAQDVEGKGPRSRKERNSPRVLFIFIFVVV